MTDLPHDVSAAAYKSSSEARQLFFLGIKRVLDIQPPRREENS